MTFQVLIVDDEPNVADSIALLLESGSQYDLELHTAYRAPQALEIMQRIRIDLLITDIQMPGMNGLALIREARKLWPDCAAVILSAYSDFEYAYEAISQQVAGYILKTEEESAILSRLYEAIARLEERLNHREWLNKTEEWGAVDEALRQSLLINVLHDAQMEGERAREALMQMGFQPGGGPITPLMGICRPRETIDLPLLKNALNHYLGARPSHLIIAPLQRDRFFILLQMDQPESCLISVLETAQAAMQQTCRREISFIVGHPLQGAESMAQTRMELFHAADRMQDDFALCVTEQDKAGDAGQVTVEFLKAYIRAHIEQNPSLTQLAQTTGYNATYLSRMFSAGAHETLAHYIARKRMEAIRSLMLDNEMSLDQIMQKMNFSSRSYFNSFVKKETGLSPKKFRAQLGL